MNEYQRARRFEDRTRWAPLCLIGEQDCRPAGFGELTQANRLIVFEVTKTMRRMMKVTK